MRGYWLQRRMPASSSASNLLCRALATGYRGEPMTVVASAALLVSPVAGA